MEIRIVGILAGSRVAQSPLFNPPPTDPLVLTGMRVLLLGV
jgi:hypothetical protein